MVYWTPEGIVNIISSSFLFVLVIILQISPRTNKILSVKYLALSFLFASIFSFLVFFSILFLSEMITIVYNLMLIGVALFFVIGLNYIMKDRIFSTNLLIALILSALLVYAAFQSPVVKLITVDGYYSTIVVGYFSLFSDLLSALILLNAFYWGLKTLLYCPPIIKTKAKIFFIGTTIMSIATLFCYFLNFFFPIFLIIYPIVFSLGISIFTINIIFEPKLLYILPFELNRILVKDREGFPLFDHDWSESNISDNIFSGFISAVQIMSKEVIDKGGILDIILSDGILILRESEFISVGLVASKPSKLLRKSLINFSDEFETKFMKLLNTKCREINKYDEAYLLIDKYFSNFPSKLVSSKDSPLYLTMKYKEIPPELDNELKKIFSNNNEYEAMKKEFLKYPESMIENFLKFYEENKDKIPYKDDKILENKNS